MSEAKNKEKVQSCDFVINGISDLRRKMNLSKNYMKVLDNKLKDFQNEVMTEKMKEYE